MAFIGNKPRTADHQVSQTEIGEIVKTVEARTGDRERAVAAREKNVEASYQRLRECHELIVAALTDAGHTKLANHITGKINGLYEAKP